MWFRKKNKETNKVAILTRGYFIIEINWEEIDDYIRISTEIYELTTA